MPTGEELAEFVAERAKRDPKTQQIIREVQMLDGLREHVGWRRLIEKVRGDRDGFLTSITRRLMAGETVARREIDFHRGYYQGALDVLEYPEKAEENLERAARLAWAQVQLLELTTQNEEESPYV